MDDQFIIFPHTCTICHSPISIVAIVSNLAMVISFKFVQEHDFSFFIISVMHYRNSAGFTVSVNCKHLLLIINFFTGSL
jgi:hypothetical protein